MRAPSHEAEITRGGRDIFAARWKLQPELSRELELTLTQLRMSKLKVKSCEMYFGRSGLLLGQTPSVDCL